MLDIKRVLLILRIGFRFASVLIMQRFLHERAPGPSLAVRLRVALEELGLTYLKLGQYLATRFDILPPEVCDELIKLFEDVLPIPFEEVKTVIESELQGPLQTFFPVFHREPIAAASVAQVHKAQTQAGVRVAVKIQRPDIERTFAADMRNFRRVAKLVDVLGLFPGYSAKEAIEEFTNWTQQEMDFTKEGRAADRLRINAVPYEIIPKIYWDLTTSKVLTMEFVDGMSLSHISDLLEAGKTHLIRAQLPNFDVKQLGDHLSFVLLRQLFVTGFFHGDPHPGNILICDDNRIALVDFGIIGELTDEQRAILVGQIENIALGNIDESFRYYAKQYIPTDETDLRAFEQDGKSVFRQWYQTSVNPYSTASDRHIGKWGREMLEVARRHRLRARAEILLFWRALYVLDYSALRLSEYFDIISATRSFFERIRPGIMERVLKVATGENVRDVLPELGYRTTDRLSNILDGLTRAAPNWPLYHKESSQLCRIYDGQIKCLSLGAVGISLLVISFADSLDTRVSLSILALAVLLIILSIFRLKR